MNTEQTYPVADHFALHEMVNPQTGGFISELTPHRREQAKKMLAKFPQYTGDFSRVGLSLYLQETAPLFRPSEKKGYYTFSPNAMLAYDPKGMPQNANEIVAGIVNGLSDDKRSHQLLLAFIPQQYVICALKMMERFKPHLLDRSLAYAIDVAELQLIFEDKDRLFGKDENGKTVELKVLPKNLPDTPEHAKSQEARQEKAMLMNKRQTREHERKHFERERTHYVLSQNPSLSVEQAKDVGRKLLVTEQNRQHLVRKPSEYDILVQKSVADKTKQAQEAVKNAKKAMQQTAPKVDSVLPKPLSQAELDAKGQNTDEEKYPF